MRHKTIVLGIMIIIIASFLFFIPVAKTTVPPPTYYQNCDRCSSYIAEFVYGSVTYQVLGYGGIIPGDWGNWHYYSVYLG
jgi:hypothetical protein